MTVIPIRSVIAIGFTWMALALFWSAHLVPQLDFRHLVMFRMSQTACLAFLFVPLSTIAYATLPREMNADASALFSMVRNFFGSLSISGATALITERRQAHQSDMVHWMTPYHQPYNDYLAQGRQAAMNGNHAAQADAIARHHLFVDFTQQVAMLAYNEAFMIFGIAAFCVVPFCFLLSPLKSGGRPTAVH